MGYCFSHVADMETGVNDILYFNIHMVLTWDPCLYYYILMLYISLTAEILASDLHCIICLLMYQVLLLFLFLEDMSKQIRLEVWMFKLI